MTPFQRVIWENSIDFKELQKQVSDDLQPDNKTFEALKEKYLLDRPDFSCITYYYDPPTRVYVVTALSQQKELEPFNQYLFEKVDKVLSRLLQHHVSNT